MKYIRTKDRIIPAKDKYLQDLDIEQYSMYMQGLLKVANTIEELCDKIVIFYNKSKHNVSITKNLNTARLYYKRDKRYVGNSYVDKVYGAIFTNKGLIYVAKMNGKGELELLWILVNTQLTTNLC